MCLDQEHLLSKREFGARHSPGTVRSWSPGGAPAGARGPYSGTPPSCPGQRPLSHRASVQHAPGHPSAVLSTGWLVFGITASRPGSLAYCRDLHPGSVILSRSLGRTPRAPLHKPRIAEYNAICIRGQSISVFPASRSQSAGSVSPSPLAGRALAATDPAARRWLDIPRNSQECPVIVGWKHARKCARWCLKSAFQLNLTTLPIKRVGSADDA